MSAPEAFGATLARMRWGLPWTALHAVWIGSFLLVATPSVFWLVERWMRGNDALWYSGPHGILIPCSAAFFAWRELRQTREPEVGSAWGWPFVLPGLACMLLDVAVGTGLLGAVGMLLSVPGLSLLALGSGRTRRLAFPLALGWLMLPFPALLASPAHVALDLVSASAASCCALPLFGVDVARQGTTLLISSGAIDVSDALSGFSTLHASVTLAFILAYLTPSRARRALLLSAAPLLAVASNMLRMSALALLCYRYGFALLDTIAVPLSGYATFAGVVAVLFALAGSAARGSRVG